MKKLGILLVAVVTMAALGIVQPATAAAPNVTKFQNASMSVAEEGGSAQVPVVRQGSSLGATNSTLCTTGGGTASAGTDYTGGAYVAPFLAGQKNSQCSIPILPDTIDEANQTIVVTLSGPNVAKKTQMTITILDNDAAPTFSVVDTAAGGSEGANIPFDVVKTGATELTTKVNYATANNTAVAPGDYVANSGQLTFAPGDASMPVGVTSNTDAIDEPAQTFFLNLSAPINATIADGQGEGLISDLNVSTVTVAASDDSVGESDGMMTFTISIGNGVTEMPVTVKYGTNSGSATGVGSLTCGPGDDFLHVNGTATIPAGDPSTTVDVPVCDDDDLEPDETLTLILFDPTNSDLAVDSQGTGTIEENDDADEDGVSDATDNCPGVANPSQTDTDGDGDGNHCDADDDNDGVSDQDEIDGGSGPLDPCDPSNAHPVCDADSDGLSNGLEAQLGTSPLDQDTDGDGFDDGDEYTAGDDPTDACDPNALGSLCDFDGDGLSNIGEALLFLTDPFDSDTDNDGLTDGLEVLTLLTDPNDPFDP